MKLYEESQSLRWSISQYFEFRWWKNYLRTKKYDDYILWKKKYWEDFLHKIQIDLPSGKNILDAGCGPAGIFINLNNNRVVAIDSLLKIYQENGYLKQQLYPYTKFINIPIEEYLNESAFDMVFCINAINHVRDINASLHQISKNLKDEGLLIISTDAHRHKPLKKLFQWIPGDIMHPQQYNMKDYEVLLDKHKFNIIKKITLKSGTIFDYCVFIAIKRSI